MPNWCENILEIDGDVDDISKIVESKLEFQKLRPCPYIDDKGEPLHNAWHTWCLLHWGVKWEINQNTLIMDMSDAVPTQLKLEFPTAWGPCCEILRYLTEIMPSLSIIHRYFEGGMHIAGEYHYKDGKITKIEINDKSVFISEHFDEDYKEFLDDEE